jgi:hypothetical protein
MRALRLAVVLFAGGLVLAASAAAAPTLRLVDRSPAVVEGRGFPGGGRVVVTVRAPSVRLTRSVVVPRGGTFRLRLPALDLTRSLRCATGVTISARAGTGALVLWRPRLVDCSAPLPIPG